ncbi:ATP-dependent RNA helicase DBP3 [Wickerhamiella sorbophila]|uniref:ATP-dependent RNA helicase DBP3 n=1 Tax=Wickerhamiella sorbophila TaxID=45607 RepID=A0A2T0FK26_9ASCO|nr:ATP-dependent RNA helicase DBP3 [Wickerhamiella sorbophila]PRT55346.1 ATP-dependent RNA helicase DBP3 [Wickerhamiella sorbophila]
MAKRVAEDLEESKRIKIDTKEKEKKPKKEKKDKKEKKEKKEKKDKKENSDKKEKPKEKKLGAAVSVANSEDEEAFIKENGVGVEVPEGVSKQPLFLAMDQVPVESGLQKVLSQFPKPTPIQSATWPYLLQGLDVVGVAETGSGKTLAFGLPSAQAILTQKHSGISVLIVSPTRELAMQIDDNLKLLTAETGVKATCVYGGVPKYEQQKQLKTANIVVGTPGRLKDLINDGSLNTTRVKYLVLDEADRMLEKGFEQDIKEIIGSTPQENRQTVMFTATWPPQVRDLAATFMRPQVIKVSIGDADELTANKRIKQIVEVVDVHNKERRFLDVLRQYTKQDSKQKILVFALYKKEASRVERLLNSKGYQVAAIHGDLNQSQRTQALDDFKTGRCNLMLATDVAARGLDIPAVKVVINLTFPLTAEDYVHRIGRTGRAGQTGIAHTLFTDQEKHLSGALINVLNGANQPVPDDLLKFGSHTKKKEHSLYGAFFKNVDPNAKAKKIKFD